MNVLIICSANMCRSPMAEVILRDLSEKEGVNITVRSAGTMDIEGSEAVMNARIVCREHGLSLEQFRSSALSRVAVGDIDIILAMEMHHRNAAMELAGEEPPSVHLLGEFLSEEKQPFEILDPIGQGLPAFQASFDVLKSCLTAFLVYLKARYKKIEN